MRAAVAEGLATLVDNPLARPLLKVVLPQLKPLLCDAATKVRIAMADLLLGLRCAGGHGFKQGDEGCVQANAGRGGAWELAQCCLWLLNYNRRCTPASALYVLPARPMRRATLSCRLSLLKQLAAAMRRGCEELKWHDVVPVEELLEIMAVDTGGWQGPWEV